MSRSPVLLALLLLASILSGAEIPISDPEVVPFDTALYANHLPAVAAGDGFLVAWESWLQYGRIVPGPIWLRTYDESGPRQPVAFSVFGGDSPRAVWNGSEYLLVRTPWFAFPGIFPGNAILVSRIGADGRQLEGSEVRISLGNRSAKVVDLVWGGFQALAAARHSDNTYEVLLLDRDGQFLSGTSIDFEPGGVAARPGGGFFILPRSMGDAVAAGGIWFAAIDNTDAGLVARVLDSAGAEVDHFTISPTGRDATSVAWTGREWVTAYRDGPFLCTARFTGRSNVRTDCTPTPAAEGPVIAAGPSGTFRAWRANKQIVTDAGTASTRYSGASTPAAVVDDAGLLVAWTEATDSGDRIHLGGLTNDGTRRPEHVLSGGGAQYLPRLSRSAGQTLLVWLESDRVRAVRVDASGVPIVPDVDLSGAYGAWPAVAAREGAWLVAWSDGNEILARHLSPALAASEPEHFASGAAQDTPALAATAGGYLLAWTERTAPNGEPTRLVAQRVDANGRRVGERIFLIESSELPVTYPAIRCNTGVCLATWFRGNAIYARLLGHDGTPSGEPRVLASIPGDTRFTTILALEDGSFQVHYRDQITYVAPGGEPRGTIRWTDTFAGEGDAVIWRGKTTILLSRLVPVQDRISVTRIFAFQFPPRLRSVRH